jgi:hypothetical protein
MKPKMRRNLPGTFLTRELSAGAWRLSRSQPVPIEVYLRVADAEAAEAFRLPTVSDIEIEWSAATVVLTMTSAARRRTIKAQGAIVHEPLIDLYAALPLASFDEKARRFWRRVFRLVRIPGGRYLLKVLARRTRGRH